MREELDAGADVVWLDHLDSWQYAPRDRAPRTCTVLDLHNVYSLICERMALDLSGRARRRFMRSQISE